jgi:hypothetical protein
MKIAGRPVTHVRFKNSSFPANYRSLIMSAPLKGAWRSRGEATKHYKPHYFFFFIAHPITYLRSKITQ